jgi:hypothetical protein
MRPRRQEEGYICQRKVPRSPTDLRRREECIEETEESSPVLDVHDILVQEAIEAHVEVGIIPIRSACDIEGVADGRCEATLTGYIGTSTQTARSWPASPVHLRHPPNHPTNPPL